MEMVGREYEQREYEGRGRGTKILALRPREVAGRKGARDSREEEERNTILVAGNRREIRRIRPLRSAMCHQSNRETTLTDASRCAARLTDLKVLDICTSSNDDNDWSPPIIFNGLYIFSVLANYRPSIVRRLGARGSEHRDPPLKYAFRRVRGSALPA